MQKPAAAPVFSFGRRTGASFVAGDTEIIPQSLVLILHWRWFGYVWNWPISVGVVRNGRMEHHRIVDVTRLALWVLGMGAFVALGVSSSRHSAR